MSLLLDLSDGNLLRPDDDTGKPGLVTSSCHCDVMGGDSRSGAIALTLGEK
jgi:hypothetical protein